MDIFSKVQATIKLEYIKSLLLETGQFANDSVQTESAKGGKTCRGNARVVAETETTPNDQLSEFFSKEASDSIIYILESCSVAIVCISKNGIVIEGSLENLTLANKSLQDLSAPREISAAKTQTAPVKETEATLSAAIDANTAKESTVSTTIDPREYSDEEDVGQSNDVYEDPLEEDGVEGDPVGGNSLNHSNDNDGWSVEQQMSTSLHTAQKNESSTNLGPELNDSVFSGITDNEGISEQQQICEPYVKPNVTDLESNSIKKEKSTDHTSDVDEGITEASSTTDVVVKQEVKQAGTRTRPSIKAKVDALQRLSKGEKVSDIATLLNVKRGTIRKWQQNSLALLKIKIEDVDKKRVSKAIEKKKLPANVELLVVDGESKPKPRCKICLFLTTSMELMREHQRRVHGERPVQCPKCPRTYASGRDMRSHLQSHEILDCPECGKPIRGRKGLNQHLKLHKRARSSSTTSTFPCTDCDKVYSSKFLRDSHVKKDHKGIRQFYKCSKCDKVFSQKKSLMEHMNKHLGLKPYHCKICGDSFSYTSSLRTHLKLHDYEGNKSLCVVCGKEFSSEKSLYLHSLIHKEHRFKCDHCDKTFYQKNSLVRHTRIHTGEKPYACEVCGTRFSDVSVLARHMQLHNKRLKPVRPHNKRYEQVKDALKHGQFNEKVVHEEPISVLQNIKDGTILIKTAPNESNTKRVLLEVLKGTNETSASERAPNSTIIPPTVPISSVSSQETPLITPSMRTSARITKRGRPSDTPVASTVGGAKKGRTSIEPDSQGKRTKAKAVEDRKKKKKHKRRRYSSSYSDSE